MDSEAAGGRSDRPGAGVIGSSNGHISKEAFAAQVHTRFAIVDDTSTLPAELVQLTDGPAAAGYEQFSLLFRSPADSAAHQGIRRVDHPVLGVHELFLVPVGRDSAGLYLEAVFNRREQPAARVASP